jgi:hypothetical protein
MFAGPEGALYPALWLWSQSENLQELSGLACVQLTTDSCGNQKDHAGRHTEISHHSSFPEFSSGIFSEGQHMVVSLWAHF